MSAPVFIYLSCDRSDAATTADLQRQLAITLQPRQIVCWDRAKSPPEAFRKDAAAFLEKADLFISVISMRYEDDPDVRWESEQAIRTQSERPSLQIMTVNARSAKIPARLQAFERALPAEETVENEKIARDRQLLRATVSAQELLASAPKSNAIGLGTIALPIGIEDLKERLLAQTDRINHAPLLSLLKYLIRDVQVKRGVLDVEDHFKQLREKTRLSQISLTELREKATPIQEDLTHLIEQLEPQDLVADWREVFIRDYYRFSGESRTASVAPPFFVPVDEIVIPDTLNLPVGPTEQESLEQIGLLSFEQKNDFRRSLLLAKDAMAVKNYAQAFAHCDHVRTHIDPQSAQLYEYLLITYLQKETGQRVMQEAVEGRDRSLQYVLMFASRLRDYQRDGKCASSTTFHNLEIAAEGISDAALRLYHALPNDPLRHTGKHAEEVPDNRGKMRVILGNTLKVCRLVHPSEELLEAAVIEWCGGGKCAWMERVDVINGRFQFVPNGHYDLLGEINEMLEILQEMELSQENKIVKGRAMLREDLYFSLVAKRQVLANQILEDEKRHRPFTDTRLSIIRFVNSCLLGAEVFGLEEERQGQFSFYRLALEYLLPGLLQTTEAVETVRVRWFTLDDEGEVIAHPDCSNYHFDARAIVEKMVEDLAGKAGWMVIAPNIKESVYLQYVSDTSVEWNALIKGLAPTDFRRMDELKARRGLISCVNRWRNTYMAFPERSGQDYLDLAIRELSGEGLLPWLHFNASGQLTTVPDSLALGFDAQHQLKQLLTLSTRFTEADLRRNLSVHAFERQIMPEYQRIKKGDEKQRGACIRLMLQAMSAFKLHEDLRFLDFVWNEMTNEEKYRWVEVSSEGKELPFKNIPGFDPLAVLNELNSAKPARYRLFEMRERVAERRFQDIMAWYHHEISEFQHENRLPERKIVITIIRKLKGLYHYYPKADFLRLPLDELHGRGNIRWNAQFLGFVPVQENHFENRYFNFDYKYERYDLQRMLDNQFGEMQRVLMETGELKA